MTISEAYKNFIKSLNHIYPLGEATAITDLVFEKTTGLQKWEFRENKDGISPDEGNGLSNKLKELLLNKPVQYVIGESWFYKRKFLVNKHVLIPRPETEELIEWIIIDCKKTSNQNTLNFLEIGTGSGCIPISIKLEMPLSKVTSLDVSHDALKVAMQNAENLNAKIEFIQLDFLNENSWKALGDYDIIVSNPPYIPFDQLQDMPKNVRDFEPAVALFVDNNDPFIFYKKIALFAKTHLNKNGKIYVELNEKYAEEVALIFKSQSFTAWIKNDFYGKERMIRATLT
ncbi:MAG: peptide chain release factor N(5)-glutamine methyltransferase [Ginsengibacter sp.]